jgi:hypothetical protein
VNLVAETPLWPGELTAWGTLAVAITAVAVALFAEWRTGKRLAKQQEKHDQEIAEERRLADVRLTIQLEHSEEQLRQEREAADKRLAEEISAADERLRQERQGYQDQEQWAEASLVQVTRARMNVYQPSNQPPPDEPVEQAVAVVVNHGRYTITRVEARLCASGNVTGYGKTEHLSSWFNLSEPLRPTGIWEAEGAPGNNLTPMDLGLRYTSDVLAKRLLVGNYPLVRWTDRWDQHWEHKQGVVRKITEGEEWHP